LILQDCGQKGNVPNVNLFLFNRVPNGWISTKIFVVILVFRHVYSPVEGFGLTLTCEIQILCERLISSLKNKFLLFYSKSYLKICNYQFFFFFFIRIQRQGKVFLVVRFHVFSFNFSIIVVDFLSIVFFLDFLFEVVVLKLVIVVEELRDVGTVRSFFDVVISK